MSKPPYLKCEIAKGKCSIIEAAAGTGKTYNITNIVARIIMERNDVTIDKMVIVTFTRAAAGELKSRISQRLAELESAVNAGVLDKDDLLINLQEKLAKNELTLKQLKTRLRLALLNFDRAMIGTIHSFAMRSLSENGFDSRQKFGFVLNENTKGIISQLCNDYWRSLTYRPDAAQIRECFAEAGKGTKDFICHYVFKRLENPALEFLYHKDMPTVTRWEDIASCKEEFSRKLEAEIAVYTLQQEELANALQAVKDQIKEQNKLIKTLNSTLTKAKKAELKSPSPENSEAVMLARSQVDEAETCLELLKKEETKRKNALDSCNSEIKVIKSKAEFPARAFLKHCCEEAFEHVSREYRRISEEKNFLSNDDLILQMAAAVSQPDSSLAAKLKEKYPVGLIDEFQDTNDSQFTIFRKIFLENPESTFIVVGDPRQAIYRFRGGDIASYLTAKEDMLTQRSARLFPMNVNRRSGEKYITSLNTIFSPDWAFAMEGMQLPEQSALKGSQVLLTPDGEEVPAPIIGAVAPAMPLEDVYAHCAADVYRMIKDKYQIPGHEDVPARSIEAGDIAILTNCSWAKAEKIREALRRYGIPARLMKNSDVFTTPEARQLLTFLEGIINCGDRECLLRALITPLGDLELCDLKSEENIELRARRMQELNNIWHKRSFMVMYNELFIQFRVNDRLAGNDLSLSNFNTIADVLCEESFTWKLTPSAVLRSLERHIRDAESENDNSIPGKPETDRGTVLIDTVFGSKGLSYPVVFLPDLFDIGHSFNSDKLSKTFHHENKLCCSPFMDENQKAAERDELLQENLRKAYVAFTRARYFCKFYYGNTKQRSSALDWLFRSHDIRAPYTDMVETLKAHAKGSPDLSISVEHEEIPEKLLDEKFENNTIQQLRRPDLLPYLLFQNGFLSFSSITPHSTPQSSFDPENQDEGEEESETPLSQTPAPEEKDSGNLLFPSGTNFGNAIHKTMELCSFNAPEDELAPLVLKQLNAHGISGKTHSEAVTKMVHRMLNAPIPDCDGGTFRFSEIAPEEKKCEFEFVYEFGNAFNTRHLFNFAAKYFREKFHVKCPESIDESTTYDQGFFNGSIDLFFRHNGKFYIVDWKTNKLKSMKYYADLLLSHAMAGSRYYLQYMIYTAALFKYLKLRMPECGSEKELYDKYFGGVRYIFVRGFDGTGKRGVFSDRLPYEKLKELEEIIG
ncbi:MAG: UvrD-helicase domain-containing protein [Lentisphaeria bacterium]|nr:UvrD-helicase domain-containing protein [Lentisphaeria bacterium]